MMDKFGVGEEELQSLFKVRTQQNHHPPHAECVALIGGVWWCRRWTPMAVGRSTSKNSAASSTLSC